jgi:hypothetical protein
MGMYDYRCMITGVSLKGADTVLVLLEEIDKVHRPIALPLKGNYNRLGAIDGVRVDDVNADLILWYFQGKRQSRKLIVDPAELKHQGGMKTIDSLLGLIERNVTESPNTFRLDGQPIYFALICKAVWQSIAKAYKVTAGSSKVLFPRLFSGVSIAEEIYEGHRSEVARQMKELAAVTDFLTEHKLPWKRPNPEGEGEGIQHYGPEMRQYLEEARRRWVGCPAVLEGIRKAEREASELLEDG